MYYCPLVCAGETKIHYNSFASACLARRAAEMRGEKTCRDCKKGKQVMKGIVVNPPDGMEFLTDNDMPEGWISRPVIVPKERVVNSKYPFYIMQVGEVFGGNLKNHREIKRAYHHIARNHNKDFESWEEDNKIKVMRIR